MWLSRPFHTVAMHVVARTWNRNGTKRKLSTLNAGQRQ